MNHMPVVTWRPDRKVSIAVNVVDDDGNLRATRQILPPSTPDEVDAFCHGILTALWDRADDMDDLREFVVNKLEAALIEHKRRAVGAADQTGKAGPEVNR